MKKEKRKMKKWEKIFCLISILFILGCIGFYGFRLIKYYKVFNPKSSEKGESGLLSVEIPKSSPLVTEGSGLYMLNGSYVYKGNVENNYIKYSGLLFRIVKINYGSTTWIALDSKINILAYGDSNYKDSDINKYLNDIFVNALNKDHLEKMTICLDEKKELSEQKKCKKETDVYSTIPDAATYLNTVNESTYLNPDESLMYLRDKLSADLGNVIANNTQISYVDGKESYDIRPIISLSYDTKILGGSGTKDDPYIVDKETTNLGKTVKVGEYEWIVINDTKDTLTLALNGTLDTLKPYGDSFDTTNENSIAYYLNNEFYESLSFKDDILDTEWEVGKYAYDYTEIAKDKVTAKVGLLSIKDFKMDSFDNQYLLLNKASDDEVYAVDKNMYKVDKNMSKSVRPVIRIKASSVSEVK